jgi:transposase-like protein
MRLWLKGIPYCRKQDKKAARRFFRPALARENTRNPRTIVTDRLTS